MQVISLSLPPLFELSCNASCCVTIPIRHFQKRLTSSSMFDTPKQSQFIWGTLRFDSIRTTSICTTGVKIRENNDTWTFIILKTWQQTSLDSHEPASHILKTWQQTSLDSYEALCDSTWFARSRVSRKSTSGMTNQGHFQPTCTVHQKSRSMKLYTVNVWSRGKQLVLFSPESWCFPRQSRGKHQDSREKKTNYFPEGPYIKCFVTYLDFPLNSHIAKRNKQRRRAGNNCAIVSRSGYIWIWSGARDQESTNHSAHFVKWNSSDITKGIICMTCNCKHWIKHFYNGRQK